MRHCIRIPRIFQKLKMTEAQPWVYSGKKRPVKAPWPLLVPRSPDSRPDPILQTVSPRTRLDQALDGGLTSHYQDGTVGVPITESDTLPSLLLCRASGCYHDQPSAHLSPTPDDLLVRPPQTSDAPRRSPRLFADMLYLFVEQLL